jgi:hypothetical protein
MQAISLVTSSGRDPPRVVVFNHFVRRTSELTYGVSVSYCLVASVHTASVQVNSERGGPCLRSGNSCSSWMRVESALICLRISSGSSADSGRSGALLAGRRRQGLSQVNNWRMSHRHSKHGSKPTADG